MSLKLPAANSPVRELFDVAELAAIAAPGARLALPSFPLARRNAGAFLAAQSAAKAVNSICMRADGELWLVEFRRPARGTTVAGWRRVWNFGKP